MSDQELEQAVRTLRTEGHAPKEIARALGVRPAAVAPLVRMIAAERAAGDGAAAGGVLGEPGLACGAHPRGSPRVARRGNGAP